MDKINLVITEIQQCEKSSIKDYDVTVVLNDKALPHKIFNGCSVVPSSRYDFAEFDLFTCGCGEPGCAGFFHYVVQNKTEATVKWTFPNDNSYKVEKPEYEFERVQFEKEFEDIRSQMLKLEKKNTHLVVLVNDAQSYVGNESEGDDRFEVTQKLSEAFKWHENRLEARQAFDAMLKEKFSNLYSKHFNLNYDANLGKQELDFNYLVCRTMNQWPEKDGLKQYLKDAEETGKAIEKALFENDYQSFIDIVHNSYQRFNEDPDNHNESLWSTFNFELYEFVEQENFDVSKLSLAIS